jgi:RNA polymerase sigma-70 factor, ECF subfamily
LAALAHDINFRPDFGEIVQLIQECDSRGEELLYTWLMKGVRRMAVRFVGVEDAEECVHDIFLTMLNSIRQGVLREPKALLGYARTILDRWAQDKFKQRKRWNSSMDFDVVSTRVKDPNMTPDQLYESDTRVKVMKLGLAQLRPQEKEILVRFYLQEQDKDTICAEMGLTATQFRLLKSRSKQKLEEFTQSQFSSVMASSAAAA